jgi:hypothetical protein
LLRTSHTRPVIYTKLNTKGQAWQQERCSRTLPVKMLTEVSRNEYCRTDHWRM